MTGPDSRPMHRLAAPISVALLAACSACLAFVGNALVLTERAEAFEVRGQYDRAARVRERAITYAEKTIEKLEDADHGTSGLALRELMESLLAENKRWLAEDEAGGGDLVHLTEDLGWVADWTQKAREAEAKWRGADRAGRTDEALTRLRKAVEIRDDAMAELSALLEDLADALDEAPTPRPKDDGDEADEPDPARITEVRLEYLGYVQVRWESALENLRGQRPSG